MCETSGGWVGGLVGGRVECMYCPLWAFVWISLQTLAVVERTVLSFSFNSEAWTRNFSTTSLVLALRYRRVPHSSASI